MSNVVTFVRGPVTSIERQEPKTPERKANVAAMVDECTRKLARPHLMADLDGVVSILNARTPEELAARKEEFRLLKIQQGKDLITSGLHLIRDNDGHDASILHLRKTLAAIDPTYDPGTEF